MTICDHGDLVTCIDTCTSVHVKHSHLVGHLDKFAVLELLLRTPISFHFWLTVRFILFKFRKCFYCLSRA